MSDTISKPQLDQLRKEYRDWLRKHNSTWAESTVSTYHSDAFFMLNHDVGIDFWSSFVSDDALQVARKKIVEYGNKKNKWANPEGTAIAYLNAMELLKQFLDEKHPSLAKDWSGKAVSNINMRSEFLTWMEKQKKSSGENYSSNTISQYASALKNATGKLNLGVKINADLFYYTSLSDFEEACRIIEASPNFREIDRAAGNGAYSSSMTLYKKFLSEKDNPRILSASVQDMGREELLRHFKRPEYKEWPPQQWADGTTELFCQFARTVHGMGMDWWFLESVKQFRFGRKTLGEKSAESRFGTLRLRNDGSIIVRWRGYAGLDKLEPTSLTKDILEQFERADTSEGEWQRKFSMPSKRRGYWPDDYLRIPATDDVPEKKRYWLYAPGEGAQLWDDFFKEKIMAIGWDSLGNLEQYSTKNDVKTAVNQFYNDGKDHRNITLALWQFCNEMQPGDVVFVKKGISKIIGRGIIEGEYEYHPQRQRYLYVRSINWTHSEEKPYPERLASYVSTLGDITNLTEVCQSLENAYEVPISDPPANFLPYSKEDFLREVYMSEERYNTLAGLLMRKKNVILQGAPGVGKTFAAARLAYSIMGERDTSRVKTVQFHQSYSYEDFVMGYRPSKDGFALEKGPFYNFCKDAETDSDRPYFFIIDEINRGNLSQIFGELLMLIEHDKRGEKHAIRLLYAEEQFSVPENVHIIGMMNTADRSLAMIDYALRRRFAFFEIKPAFDTEGFKNRQAIIQNSKYNRLIDTIKSLNRDIADDASLGSGFQVGHSYFCALDVVSNESLSDIVEFELIPLLSEYWFDEPRKIEQWTKQLRGTIRG